MFDRVLVLNLDRRPDRWEVFCDRLPNPWPWPVPERVSAIDGLKLRVPTKWRSGPGAYGCLESHLRIWQEAAEEDQSILVFEDDAIFCEGFLAKSETFLCHVPDDWQMIYFGGQHVMPPDVLGDGILRLGGTKKTHAYAIRGEVLRRLPKQIEKAEIHIDVCLAQLHHAFPAYAPSQWLCGQSASVSDVLHRSVGEPERWFDQRRAG